MYACTSVLRTNDKKYQEETIHPRNQKLQVELDRLNAILTCHERGGCQCKVMLSHEDPGRRLYHNPGSHAQDPLVALNFPCYCLFLHMISVLLPRS